MGAGMLLELEGRNCWENRGAVAKGGREHRGGEGRGAQTLGVLLILLENQLSYELLLRNDNIFTYWKKERAFSHVKESGGMFV